GRQGHFFDLGPIPSVEQNAPVLRRVVDGVQALPQLVHRLVQQYVLRAFFVDVGDLGIAPVERVLDLRVPGQRQQLVGRPAAPLHAVHGAEVVGPFAVRVGEPGGIFVGVLVPYLAAQVAKVCRAARAAQEAYQFAHRGLERKFLGGDGGKTLLKIKAQRGARQRQRADARAIFLPRAVVENGLDEREILFHGNASACGGPAQAACGSRVSTISTEKLSSAVFSSMAEAEQYFSCDSCTARSTAARGRLRPVTVKAKWMRVNTL